MNTSASFGDPGLNLDISIAVLAFASAPLGLVALYDFTSGERERGLFGVASAAWSLCGVVLVYYGAPGLLFFPGLLAILIVASLRRARRGGGRLQYAKATLLAVLLCLTTVGMVLM